MVVFALSSASKDTVSGGGGLLGGVLLEGGSREVSRIAIVIDTDTTVTAKSIQAETHHTNRRFHHRRSAYTNTGASASTSVAEIICIPSPPTSNSSVCDLLVEPRRLIATDPRPGTENAPGVTFRPPVWRCKLGGTTAAISSSLRSAVQSVTDAPLRFASHSSRSHPLSSSSRPSTAAMAAFCEADRCGYGRALGIESSSSVRWVISSLFSTSMNSSTSTIIRGRARWNVTRGAVTRTGSWRERSGGGATTSVSAKSIWFTTFDTVAVARPASWDSSLSSKSARLTNDPFIVDVVCTTTRTLVNW